MIERLGITPCAQSIDYLEHKQQFQLHALLTEQRHPRTTGLSQCIGSDTTAGLRDLLSVDQDIIATFDAVAANPEQLARLQAASLAVQQALRDGHRIYFYGTGSTGRLAETLESGLWRPFWRRLALQYPALWQALEARFPGIEARVRGEITGGDRALISSLEGFEDLPLIGRLQLQDHAISAQDVVFAVTEGGETSAVIGTALAAAAQEGATAGHTWFVYNNPDHVLRPFDRSRQVLDDARIGKIELATGPQSITGSTRMQATTTSLYALGVVLEDALQQLLTPVLSAEQMQALGFHPGTTIASGLRRFGQLQKIAASAAPQLAPWTNLETITYRNACHATYLAQRALMPVFVDVTERGPTFRLAPLDRCDTAQRTSWIQVWAPVETPQQAWDALLQRPFHGLDATRYSGPFQQQIDDPYLRASALHSLKSAGAEQQVLYDLSASATQLQQAGPRPGDLGVLVLLGHESLSPIALRWLQQVRAANAAQVVFSVSDQPLDASLRAAAPTATFVDVQVPQRDPFGLNQAIVLKMLLNAHSTGVMAKLGRVVGNTMTSVQPGNLKLYGRATHLIQSLVNEALASTAWRKAHGTSTPLSYADANAVMFEAIEQRHALPEAAQTPEVELTIVAVLQALASGQPVAWPHAAATLQQKDLATCLAPYAD
ncbi:hypothetical protein [Pseudoxanthomonas sp.]|uniref:hypothetical protein n=1 Tax=Pseudoxanthomonas sp. TaxID=1871049 RepID=UPI00261A78CD|nr:hypothetical protein [Pseudoxanthomonas sp.]WDS35438.1 MAG: hypothetical protein O8I58_13940 [Pseudoxanthomonas sp.]